MSEAMKAGGRPRRATPSLSSWVAGPLIFSLLVLVGPGLWIAARVIEGAILSSALDNLTRSHDEWTRRLNDRLVAEEASAARFGRVLSAELQRGDAHAPERFDALIGPAPDGGRVSREAGFDPKRDAVLWLPAAYPLDDKERLFLLEAKRLTELYSAGAPGEAVNTWLVPAHNGLVMYWPSYTTYLGQVDTTVDFVNSEWMTLALPANNPEGAPRWTPTSYDPGAREWMVSVVVPFFRGGVFAGTAGHDVTVNMVMSSFRELALYAGTGHALVRGDGTLLVSSVHQDRLHESKGTLTIDAVGDVELERAFEEAKRGGAAAARVVGNTERRVLVAARIAAPDWHLITDVPRAELLSSVKGLYWNYWLMAALAILAIVVLPVLVIMRVTVPSVRQLVAAADRIRGGDLEQRFQASGTREFVHIGDALNAMAHQLGDSFAALEKTNEELERRVEERTVELKEAKVAADAANKAKGDFLANMSHELRTPLNGILGYAQILRRSKRLGEQEVRGIEVIAECGSHLLMLIGDVLDLAKIESRTMDLHPNDFHLPSFLRSTIAMCRIRAQDKGILFTERLVEPLPEGVRADQRRLRQVLVNLLGNAIKFTEMGSVTFTVKVVQGGEAQGDLAPGRGTCTVRFEIEDTGIGIPADQADQVFLPFKQAGEGKLHAEGTGLGLAISQRIVGLMGGSIQVRSEVAKGSVFWMDLTFVEAPRWRDTANFTAQGIVVGYQGPRRRILVVDDKSSNRAVLGEMLGAVGFEVAEAENGEEGLEKATTGRFDLIVTDLVMPVLDGWEMMRRLKEKPELAGLKIIASSASAYSKDHLVSLEAGADEFLPKPLHMDELLQMLQRLLALEWIHEQRGGAPAAASSERRPGGGPLASHPEVVPPSVEDLRALLDLARDGLVSQLQRYADKLERADPKVAPFVKHLRELSRSVQLNEIESFINKCIGDAG